MFKLFSSTVRALLWRADIQETFNLYPPKYTDSFSYYTDKLPEVLPSHSAKSRVADLYSVDQIELYPKPLYMQTSHSTILPILYVVYQRRSK